MSVPEIELRPAVDHSLRELADLMTRGFAGYTIEIRETPETFAARLRRDGVDLARSRVASIDGEAVGVLLLATRGASLRVAAVGVTREARRHGIGRRLMEEAREVASAVGARRLVLEVIQGNEGAVALYHNQGMRIVRELVGWDLAPDGASLTSPSADVLEEVDPLEVARRVAADASDDLSWQLAAETVAGWGTDARAFTLGGEAFVAVSVLARTSVVLVSLVVRRQSRRRGWGRRLVEALVRHHGGRPLKVPAILPAGTADDFLYRVGFVPSEIKQYEMELTLP